MPRILLFGGRVGLGTAADGETVLTASLDMNLTRFLAQRFEESREPGVIRTLPRSDLKSLLRNRSYERRQRHTGESLDHNDNFIPDRILRSGQAPSHLEWLLPYVEGVCRFLSDELSDAAQRALAAGSITAPRHNPLIPEGGPLRVEVPLLNWSLPQLEIYWEFWTRNAISEAGELSLLWQRVAPRSRLTAWEPISSETHNALVGVSTGLGVTGAIAKGYAKLEHRLRFEVEYTKNPKDVERIASAEIDRLNPEGLPRFVAQVTGRAAARADRLMQQAFAGAISPHAPINQTIVTGFLEALAREAGTPALFSFMLNSLVATGRVPARRNYPELRHAMMRLVDRGYFEGVASGLARSFGSYRPVSPYERIVEGLQALTLTSR